MTTRGALIGVLLITRLLVAAPPALAADAVVHWNEVATTNMNAANRGPAGILDLAKVHLAIHDAVQAFDREYESYCGDIENATGSPAAAVARAARDVLIALLPAAQDAAVEAAYQAYLAANGLAGNAGLAVGQQAAACILALRANDGSFPTPPPTFFGGTEPGQWRPTTPTPTSMVQPWFASVEPFALKDPSQLTANVGPPALTSGHYARDYEEVKAVGSKNSTVRTPEQTDLANFYSEGFLILVPRTLRTIATAYSRDLGESARFFALATMASSDALISAWDSKLTWNFWRPVTAIREGDNDGNDRTVGDPLWEPFLTTPNYPDYTSGANNLVSAAMRTAQHVLKSDRLPFTVESKAPAAIDKLRTYERFSDMCQDVINVRIYQGIHFRFADEVAFQTGRRAADWVFSHMLRSRRR